MNNVVLFCTGLKFLNKSYVPITGTCSSNCCVALLYCITQCSKTHSAIVMQLCTVL